LNFKEINLATYMHTSEELLKSQRTKPEVALTNFLEKYVHEKHA